MFIYEKLTAIQKALKAPKNANNDFGKYKYRTIDSINEALKRLLDEHKVSLTLSDEIEMIGDRFYVKSTATLIDFEHSDKCYQVSSVAYAREPDTSKGKDESQITGSAATYARKYALTGLFLLDDSTNDPDKTNGETKCANCGAVIKDEALIKKTMKSWKKPICQKCIDKKKAEYEAAQAEKPQ